MAIGFAMYVFLVAALRDQRAHDLQKRFGMLKRDDYARMTADDSQAILKQLTELEFPKFMGFSIVFALFKVIATVFEYEQNLTLCGLLPDLRHFDSVRAPYGYR